MNLKQLEYMLKVAELGSFTKAAAELYIAQPSLSQSIRSLESELEVTLFDRSNKSIALTEEGREFAETARRILSEYSSFTDKMASRASAVGGRLIIGTSPARGNIVLPKVLPVFMSRYPHVKIVVEEYPASEVEDMVVNGQIDLCMINGPVRSDKIEQRPLMEDRMLLITSPKNNLDEYASYKNKNDIYPTVSIKHIGNQKLVTVKKNQRMYSVTMQILEKGNVHPDIILESRDCGTVIKFVSANIGFSIMIESAVRAMDSYLKARCYYIEEWPQLWPSIIGYHKNRLLSNAAKAFINTTEQIIMDPVSRH